MWCFLQGVFLTGPPSSSFMAKPCTGARFTRALGGGPVKKKNTLHLCIVSNSILLACSPDHLPVLLLPRGAHPHHQHPHPQDRAHDRLHPGLQYNVRCHLERYPVVRPQKTFFSTSQVPKLCNFVKKWDTKMFSIIDPKIDSGHHFEVSHCNYIEEIGKKLDFIITFDWRVLLT